MSNRLTTKVLATLAMAVTAEAVTEPERRITLQLASLDQAVSGIGTVGFALVELSWPTGRPADFDAAKAFLGRSIRRAREGVDWTRLPSAPPLT